MKINEVISKTDEDVYEICSTISSQCSEFISDMRQSEKFLLRGINSEYPWFEDKSPTYRYPRGQTVYHQKLLDLSLEMLGFGSLRHNSICCTSSLSRAMNFAPPYLIFPKNGYKFTWSPKIKDTGGNQLLYDELFKLFYRGNSDSVSLKDAQILIDTCGLKNTDMVSALESGNEITIHGEYIAIRHSYKNTVGVYLQ